MFKILGFIILIISCVLFILIPVVPWMGLSKETAIWTASALLISGEVLFYLSLFILGKTYWEKIKAKLLFWRSKPKA
jgi:hypothetical protein